VLAAHLKMGKVVRPLILGKTDEELTAYIQGMLDQREPFYMKAKHIFNVDLLNSREKVAESVRLLREATGI
jgi:shikimate kinase